MIEPSAFPHRSTILAVDDEPANITLIDAALVPFGYTVVGAADAAQGLALARTVCPAVILLDIAMPGQSGIDACREWRALPELADAAIILTTAISAGSARLQGLRAGADDYLEKPLDIDLLTRTVRRWSAARGDWDPAIPR